MTLSLKMLFLLDLILAKMPFWKTKAANARKIAKALLTKLKIKMPNRLILRLQMEIKMSLLQIHRFKQKKIMLQ